MKAKDVQIKGVYLAKVSGSLAKVRIDRVSPFGGWDGTNLETGRSVRIRTAQRLRGPAKVTPINLDDLARYITSIIGQQKSSDASDLIGFREATERDLLANFCLVSLIELAGHVSRDHAERERVDSHLSARDFFR